MAKFNTSATIKITNKEGFAAYSMSDKEKLITQVLTSFFNEKKFYGDNSNELQDTAKAVIRKDPQFVANLAAFARREFNMRSVSHVLTAHLAHEPAGKPFVRQTVKAVSLRGDDVTEIMACYLSLFGKPIPNALRKGIADVLGTFDAYTLAKYKGENNEVKMRDLLCLCRPTPRNAEQSALWKQCLEGTLQTPYTWESELSAKGNTKEVWEALIDSGKVGYMALLRNLRNIFIANPDNFKKVLDHIQDPEAVAKSRQLPFRFLSAYRELARAGAGSCVFDALEAAADAAVMNMPKLKGTTVIAIDTSGSMGCSISDNSEVRCCDIAWLLGLMANRICENAILYSFDSQVRQHSVPGKIPILHTALESASPGGWTDMTLPFSMMIDKNVKADRVIILSDNQCNCGTSGRKTVQTYANQYRRESGHDIWVHAVDLQGYGTQQFAGAKTNVIAGWSEKVFSFIALAEQGNGTLVKAVEEYIC